MPASVAELLRNTKGTGGVAAGPSHKCLMRVSKVLPGVPSAGADQANKKSEKPLA